MRAHLVQLDIRWEDKPSNYAATSELVRSAQVARGDLIVLPEMFDTGFSFRLEQTADSDGRTLQFLSALARETGATIHGSRSIVGADGRGRNCATIMGPSGGLICEFEKIHPFTLGKEVEHFTGGREVKTYEWATGTGEVIATVCPSVCYDLRFPELYRIGLIKGRARFAAAGTVCAGQRRLLALGQSIVCPSSHHVSPRGWIGSKAHSEQPGKTGLGSRRWAASVIATANRFCLVLNALSLCTGRSVTSH